MADSDALSFPDRTFSVNLWLKPDGSLKNTILVKKGGEWALVVNGAETMVFGISDPGGSKQRWMLNLPDIPVWRMVTLTYEGCGNFTCMEIYWDTLKAGPKVNNTGTFIAMQNMDSPVSIGADANPRETLLGLIAGGKCGPIIVPGILSQTQMDDLYRFCGEPLGLFPDLDRGPYLQHVTDTSAKILWETEITLVTELSFGTDVSYGDTFLHPVKRT